MLDNKLAVDEFESLWIKATTKRDFAPAINIEYINPDIPVIPLLQRLSGLADKLQSSEVIDKGQHQQMQSAIATVTEVIETIDPTVLAEVLESLE